MLNFLQQSRLKNIDHKLIELNASDIEDLFFKEGNPQKGNRVFTRYHKKTRQLIKLEMISSFQFNVHVLTNGEWIWIYEKPIKRWHELVTVWQEITNSSVFVS